MLEHSRSADEPPTTLMLCYLIEWLGKLVLHCGTCHEVLPAAPRALEALAAAMQQLQVGMLGGWVSGLGRGGQFAQWGTAWWVTLDAPPHGSLAAR